jgi:catechol 2,3-dioxygenase-like lactoylglutathione lyase family enzyme
MAKIRHIAYRAEDVEGMANFFVNALGLEIVRRREMGAIDLSDGSIGITILPAGVVQPAGQRSGTGVDHIGFTVEDEEAQRQQLLGAGATETNAIPLGEVFYELKFHGPEGIIIDVGHWVGTAPVSEEAASKV